MATFVKGFSATSCKDAFLIAAIVAGAVTKLSAAARELLPPASPLEQRQQFGPLDDFVMRPTSGALEGSFYFAGHKRTLTVNLDCDCDAAELAPQSVSIMMGDFGHADLIVQTVLAALRVLGPVYYMPYASEEYTALDLPATKLADLRAEDIISGYTFDKLADRASKVNLHLGRSMPFAKEFGYSPYAYLLLQEKTSDSSDRWKAIRKDLINRGFGMPAYKTQLEQVREIARALNLATTEAAEA